MGKTVFHVIFETEDIESRFYDYGYDEDVVDVCGRELGEEEAEKIMHEIAEEMAAPGDASIGCGSVFNSWFYHKRPDAYDMMAEIIRDAIDDYVLEALHKKVGKKED